MATAVSVRPAAPVSKVKRPVPPALQTTSNGITSRSSPSPSLSTKRPPSGQKHPPFAGYNSNGGHAILNGSGPRLNKRKDSQQKPAEGNKPRLGKAGPNEMANGERRPSKKVVEPYVRSASYMLKKYRKSAPSLILHLHPTHFRLEQQDGSFSYSSPARKLLEHIRDETVPHDMLDELHQAGIKFYEGCLIVQIHDHRNTSKDTTSSSTAKTNDRNQSASIHSYNQYLTPSPYVPYPNTKVQDEAEASPNTGATGKAETLQRINSANNDQENPVSKTPRGPRTFTTVLFPTSLTLQEDVLRYANAVDQRSINRKSSQAGNSRAPGAGTGTGPSANIGTSGPPAKKQKLQYSNKSLQSIESTMILSTAPPLHLDPVKDADEAQALLDKLADPLCCRDPPAPKSRKRTIAELAADEALAAEEQRFMLIMDERLGSGFSVTGTGKAVGADNEGTSTNFEARFERFKTLEEIKQVNSEKKERETQQLPQAQQPKAKAEAESAHEQKIINAKLANAQVSQSPPVVRNMTPQTASSPPMPNAVQRGASAVSMNISNSAQGAGSPPRPGSALQHGHPGPVSMAAQRSQQPPSRNGTPSMPNGTPRGQHATPVMRNLTPTPRMSQTSPVNSVVAGTPMIGHSMIGAAHINGQPSLTPQQAQAHAMIRQQQQQQQQQHHQARHQAQLVHAYQQQHMHGSPPNRQLQQFIAQQAHQQQRAGMQSHDQDAYRQLMQNMTQQQMHGNAGNHQMMNGMMLGHGQNLFGNQQQPNMAASMSGKLQFEQLASRYFENLRAQAIIQYGPNIPQEAVSNMKQAAIGRARAHMAAQQKKPILAQQQQAMINHMQQNAAMNGMGGM
ncbi:MAG: hypothetical protein LQ340_003876 [Diploschistes diacapsis]|nr:MAG: hypothetical protein LQ340_003876 [Diploschistes diacapsis]